MKNSPNYLLGFLLLWAIAGCSQESSEYSEDYIKEADALCDALDPEYWAEASKGKTPVEISTMLSGRISASISSERMISVLSELSSVPTEKKYSYFQSAVMEMTGTEYDCPALKEYFAY